MKWFLSVFIWFYILSKHYIFAIEQCPRDMVFIPKGIFMMGEVNNLKKIFTESFCVDQREITQIKYKLEMGKNPSYFKGDRNPVETVSWFQADKYCKKLDKRLPSEIEWEKSARAGSLTKYYWGNKMNIFYLWYSINSEYKTHPVGEKKPNQYGLYDILGNVYEWTTSWDSDEKKFKVIRGGSWANRENSVRTAYRDRAGPFEKGSDVGFRCVQ